MTLPDNLLICRICVLKKSSYANIFEDNGSHEFCVADIINELLELNVFSGDGLPDKICCDCLNELARFKRFKSISHEAKVTLEYIVKQNVSVWPQVIQNISSSLNKTAEEKVVEIVDLVEHNDDSSEDEDSGAETVTAPSPASKDVCSDHEFDMSSEDILEEVVVRLVGEESSTVANASDKTSVSTVNKSTLCASISNAVYLPIETYLDGKDTEMVVSKDPLDVAGDEVALENDLLSEEESMLSWKELNDSDVVELESEVSLPVDSVSKAKHCSSTSGVVRTSKDTIVESEDSQQDLVAKDIEKGNHHSSRNLTAIALGHSDSSNESSYKSVDNIVKCSKCAATFDSDLALESHLEKKVCNILKCPICSKYMSSQKDFDKHQNNCKKPQPYVCKVCRKTFAKSSSLKRHKEIHSEKEKTVCSNCNKTFRRKRELESHMKQCKISKDMSSKEHVSFYKCGGCGIGYKRKLSLKAHLQRHSSKVTCICGHCGINYKLLSDLDQHILNCHWIFKCNVCSKSFMDKYHFNRHASIHKNERLFYCNFCGSSYKTHNSLDAHVLNAHKC